MTTKRILSSIGIGAGAIIIGLGIQYALAAWTPPHGAPTDCPSGYAGCDAPINVGTVSQAKNAGLGLGTTVAPTAYTLDVEAPGAYISTILTQGFTLNDGSNNSKGKILQSSNNTGLVAWVATSSLGLSGGSSGVSKIIAGTNVTISPTTGVGNVTINSRPTITTVILDDDSGGYGGRYLGKCPDGEVVTQAGAPISNVPTVRCATISITVN